MKVLHNTEEINKAICEALGEIHLKQTKGIINSRKRFPKHTSKENMISIIKVFADKVGLKDYLNEIKNGTESEDSSEDENSDDEFMAIEKLKVEQLKDYKVKQSELYIKSLLEPTTPTPHT